MNQILQSLIFTIFVSSTGFAHAEPACEINDALPLSLAIKKAISPIVKAAPVAAPSLSHRFYISPDEMRKYDTRTIAKLLVDRIHNECDLAANPDPTEKEVGNDSETIMMVPSRVLSSIAVSGFQNQHMTNSTNGCACTKNRFDTEQELGMTELPYSNKGRELLPKYSAFNVKRDGFGSFPMPTSYGDAALVFKKSVQDRTTWTYSDSLRGTTGHVPGYGGDGGYYYVNPGSDPKSPFSNGNITHTNRYRRDKGDKNICMGYCEAQIWGDLDLTDVDSIMVSDPSKVTDDLKKLNIPIYQMDTSTATPHQAEQYTKGVLLYSPPAASKPSAPTALSESQLNALINPATPPTSPLSGPALAIDKSLLLGTESETELEKTASDALASVGAASPYGGGYYYSQNIDQNARVLGEIASREKTPASIKYLEDNFDKGTEISQSMSLYGLSELPWKDIKSRVLQALATGPASPQPSVQLLGIAIAADHQDDTDIKAALKNLNATSTNGIIKEHLDRLNKKHFCDPKAPDLSDAAGVAK